MTELEALRSVIVTLDRINVPVQLTEQIGIPIYNSSNTLKNIYENIVNRMKANEESKKTEPEPEQKNIIELVPETNEDTKNEEEPENETVE